MNRKQQIRFLETTPERVDERVSRLLHDPEINASIREDVARRQKAKAAVDQGRSRNTKKFATRK